MKTLEPKEVFGIFHEITRVPRPSKHEEHIREWLINFAKSHNLDYQIDAIGNVVMRSPASSGYEQHEGVILQAHMDMVCEKNNDTEHDFLTEGISTYIDGDFIKAHGTTLGGDDGIGMAMALSALISPTLKHPALEALFTVDEETGLTGADNLGEGMLTGKRLINLDSEDDGQIFIGCAGGIDTLAKLHYKEENTPSDMFAALVKIGGLMGGHSGDDINKGRANANKLLVRYLFKVSKQTDLRIASINGGNLRNAIAREAFATILVPFAYKEQLRIDFNHFVAEIEGEFKEVEKDLRLTLESCDFPEFVLPKIVSDRLLLSLYACPHGVYAMSKDMPGLVETSTNLASVKMKEDEDGKYVEINTSQRSSVESQKHNLKNMVECALRLSGATVTHGDGYPGWAPNVHSKLLEQTKQAYIDVTGQEPEVKAIHAGLECGLFLTKYPYLDMVSVGPQMSGVHSPMEQLSISSTRKTWEWLKRILSLL
ncbi:MAG: aminoacyl-histidine dipeptidase [Paludibacteraceae bacterium]|nr:aminoacyl-histidine dipeptidase [Paludibacteraceae bacterium]